MVEVIGVLSELWLVYKQLHGKGNSEHIETFAKLNSICNKWTLTTNEDLDYKNIRDFVQSVRDYINKNEPKDNWINLCNNQCPRIIAKAFEQPLKSSLEMRRFGRVAGLKLKQLCEILESELENKNLPDELRPLFDFVNIRTPEDTTIVDMTRKLRGRIIKAFEPNNSTQSHDFESRENLPAFEELRIFSKICFSGSYYPENKYLRCHR